MTSTRRQKIKGKSLCMTDYFVNNDQNEIGEPCTPVVKPQKPLRDTANTEDSNEGAQSPLSDSPNNSRDSLPPTMPSPKQGGLKRGSSIPVSTRQSMLSSLQGEPIQTSASNSPSSCSPQKHRAKMDDELCVSQEVTADPKSDTRHASDLLDTFPTSNQAVSESFLKEMMLALRSSIQQSFTEALNQQTSALDDLGERVSHVEDKMGEFSDSHNSLVDSHNRLEDELDSLKTKLADMEDRNRRNNIKFRGIPESVPPAELTPYLQRLIREVLPSVTTHDLIIDRAHRLPKPKGLPDTVPRDVIARIHFYHIKEDLMSTARKLSQLPEPFSRVKLFADLSQSTLQARRHLAPVTTALRQHNVMYRWGFPTKIILTRNGVTSIIRTLEEGSVVLKDLGIMNTPMQLTPRRPEAGKITRDWAQVKGHA